MSDTEIVSELKTLNGTAERIRRTINNLKRQAPTLGRPPGIGAQTQGGGWWWVTWKAVPNASGYEYSHEFGSGRTPELRTTIFAIPNGDRRSCRIRALSDADTSGWVTVTVIVDATGKLVRIDVDGEDPPPPPPDPPDVPVITAVTAGHQNVAAWWDSDDATQWDVRLIDTAEQIVQQVTVDERFATFNHLELGTRYGVQVAALAADGQRSEWTAIRWTKTLDDPTGPPSPPTGLRVHCVADRTAKAEWDAASDVDGWEVWLDDDHDDGDFTITPLVRLVELEPDTEYTVTVVAVRDDHRSGIAQLMFRTLGSILPPDPEPDPDNEPDYDAPGGVVVQPTGESSIEVFWTGDGADHAAVSLDGRTWLRVDGTYHEWTGLQPGPAYTAHVYTVTGKQVSAIARKAATTRRRD